MQCKNFNDVTKYSHVRSPSEVRTHHWFVGLSPFKLDGILQIVMGQSTPAKCRSNLIPMGKKKHPSIAAEG